ncbi:response regulator [Flavobacterium soli]|uniref:response regulator n=1 Tax=Flavobacterium soli TaxID=344881 RepID=UPI0003FB9466|nr:response regulator [Flavobacterium soli]
MNVLVVDDHPMTVSGYIESLSLKGLFLQSPSFYKAYSCKEAFLRLAYPVLFDLAIIDYGLPSHEAENIYSGIDLARLIQQQHPDCKIIMITAHTEVLIIYDIFKKLQPDGLIVKNDITPENLPWTILQIIEGNNHQSPTAKNIIKEIWKKDLMVDDTNRQILLYLSKGYKLKKIEITLLLSLSAIQRRIAQMKAAFDVKEDSSLVEEAILSGFL